MVLREPRARAATGVAAAVPAAGATVDQRPPDADSLVGPDDPERTRRLAWSELLRRVWDEDVLRFSRCGGEMKLIAVIENPAVIEKLRKHVGRWRRGPPRTRHVVVEPADREPPYVDD